MARKQEIVKELYPLHHEHAASLERVLQEATMLMNALDTILPMEGVITQPAVKARLVERVKALRLAMYGDA